MRVLAGAVVVTAILAAPGFAAPEFVASFRSPEGMYVTTAVGALHRSVQGTPTKVFDFSDSPGRPHRWSRPVRSIAQFRSAWLVADGSNHLIRFDGRGILLDTIETRFHAAMLCVAGDRLWVLNSLAQTPGEQLWSSLDGSRFEQMATSGPQARFETPLRNLLVLAGGRRGELYVAPVIGPPSAKQVWPRGKRAPVKLAYSRTRHRASLADVIGLIEDVTPYSQPVRDMLVTDNGDLFVLRNREDVQNTSGRVEAVAGRRVDRYDAAGRHLSTAVLPETVRWLAEVNTRQAVGITKSGTRVSAEWRRAIPAEVIEQ